jgi:DNA repair exonuclease SbcCD ATPase subunit
MVAHEVFEQLCAMAVTGEITADEFRRLQEHLHECPSCRACYRDFHSILGDGLPIMAEPRGGRWSPRRFGLKKRFVERARKEGILVADSTRPAWRTPWIPVTAALLALLAWPAYRFQGQRREADEKIALLSRRIAELERVVSEKPEPPPVQVPPQATRTGTPNDRGTELEKQLAAFRAQYDAALADKGRLEERVSRLYAQLDQAHDESRTARADGDSLARNLQEAKLNLARANQELESVRSARSQDVVTIVEQRTRLDQLTAKLREQAEILDREREFLAAAKEIRDLMGARNIRVAEVADVGGPRRRGVPGRVFYSREKLIYYAFDLENRADIRKVAFQVWGKREGRSQPPRSLGLLNLDDAREKRWVLRNEDPGLLAQIDHVFVTVEPPGGSRQPTSREILYALLVQP